MSFILSIFSTKRFCLFIHGLLYFLCFFFYHFFIPFSMGSIFLLLSRETVAFLEDAHIYSNFSLCTCACGHACMLVIMCLSTCVYMRAVKCMRLHACSHLRMSANFLFVFFPLIFKSLFAKNLNVTKSFHLTSKFLFYQKK